MKTFVATPYVTDGKYLIWMHLLCALLTGSIKFVGISVWAGFFSTALGTWSLVIIKIGTSHSYLISWYITGWRLINRIRYFSGLSTMIGWWAWKLGTLGKTSWNSFGNWKPLWLFIRKDTMSATCSRLTHCVRVMISSHSAYATFKFIFLYYDKLVVFRFKFHWDIFPRIRSTVCQHWLWYWLAVKQVPNHYLIQFNYSSRRNSVLAWMS